MQAIFETIFDILYLSTVLTLGIRMIKESDSHSQYHLFGLMAVTLGGGDAFHLVPRALALCTSGLSAWTYALGIGKLITSITMTVFYVILYAVWRQRYQIAGRRGLTVTMVSLALARIILSLLPQNEWTSPEPPLFWGICRNIPFAIMGLIIIVLFFRSARNDKPFQSLWLAVTISFACYIPVVLLSERIPMVGILMIPKTCAYVWIIVIGWRAMKAERAAG